MINAKKLMVAAAAAVLGIGLALSLAQGAQADPSGVGVTQNTAGVAGYYANDNGHTRFRDVQADTSVTPQIKILNGTSSNGAVGVELCDPNSGEAAQLGVWWNQSLQKYQIVYAVGTLNVSLGDPCIMTGLITPTPQTLLSNFSIAQGDHLHFEIYWNPTGRHHEFSFNACDTTLDICRQATSAHTGFLNLYEAGVGGVSNTPVLTAPALNLLNTFSNTSFNYYSSTHGWNSINVPAHWELKRADFVNGSSQVVMSSNGSLDPGGHMFNLFNGSTSA